MKCLLLILNCLLFMLCIKCSFYFLEKPNNEKNNPSKNLTCHILPNNGSNAFGKLRLTVQRSEQWPRIDFNW